MNLRLRVEFDSAPSVERFVYTPATNRKRAINTRLAGLERKYPHARRWEVDIVPDVEVSNHGSVVLVRPVTPAAKRWVEEHIELEGWQWMSDSFAVEPRYVADIVVGMRGDGLEVE